MGMVYNLGPHVKLKLKVTVFRDLVHSEYLSHVQTAVSIKEPFPSTAIAPVFCIMSLCGNCYQLELTETLPHDYKVACSGQE